MPRPDSTVATMPDAPAPTPKPAWPEGLLLTKREKVAITPPDDLRILLSPEAFRQAFAYSYSTRREIGCLGSVRRDGNAFVVERLYLVKQKGGLAHTEMDPDSVAELMEELLTNGRGQEAKSLKCWVHSHPGMGVFWSRTDDRTCRSLASDYLVSLVVSDGFSIRARIDVNTGIPFTIDHVPAFLQIQPDKEVIQSYAKEVAEKVQEAVAFPLGRLADDATAPDLFDPETWSDYFRRTYGLVEDGSPVLEPADDRDPF